MRALLHIIMQSSALNEYKQETFLFISINSWMKIMTLISMMQKIRKFYFIWAILLKNLCYFPDGTLNKVNWKMIQDPFNINVNLLGHHLQKGSHRFEA